MRFDDDPKADFWFKLTMMHALVGIPVAIMGIPVCIVIILACGKFLMYGGTTVNNITETHTTTTTTTVDARTDCGWLSWRCAGGEKEGE